MQIPSSFHICSFIHSILVFVWSIGYILRFYVSHSYQVFLSCTAGSGVVVAMDRNDLKLIHTLCLYCLHFVLSYIWQKSRNNNKNSSTIVGATTQQIGNCVCRSSTTQFMMHLYGRQRKRWSEMCNIVQCVLYSVMVCVSLSCPYFSSIKKINADTIW